MKRFGWVIPILFLLISVGAFANTITTIGFLPNDGSGDNFGFLQRGSGVFLEIHGGTPFDFFNVNGFEPGSSVGGSAPVFFSSATATFGGNTYDLLFDGPSTMFLSTFTLPTNGKDFTVRVEIGFSAFASIPDTGKTFDVNGSASGNMIFHFVDGHYVADRVLFTSAVPEPNTLGLMGTGLLGIAAFARKRLRKTD